MGPTFQKRKKFDGSICDLKSILEHNFLFREKIFPISCPKKEILMTGISDSKIILQWNFLFWKDNYQKGKFDG